MAGWMRILVVLGTVVGTVLNSVLVHLIRRRTRKRIGERVFLWLVAAGAVFNLSLLGSIFFELLLRHRSAVVCASFEAVSLVALGLIPSLLLHTFLSFYRPRLLARHLPLFLTLVYAPALTVASPLYLLSLEPEVSLLTHLVAGSLPFLVWSALAAFVTALISLALSEEVEREKEAGSNRAIGTILLGLSVTLTLIIFLRDWPIPLLGTLAQLFALFSPNILAFAFAYSMYRYNYLGYFMKESLFTTILASFALSVYFLGIRHFGDVLEHRFAIDFRVLEAALILALLFAFEPLKRAAERLTNRLFFSQLVHSREALTQLVSELNAAAVPNLAHVVSRVSDTLRDIFGLEWAWVWLQGPAQGDLADESGSMRPLPPEALTWLTANSTRVLDAYDVPSAQVAQTMLSARLSAVVPLSKNGTLIGSIQLGLRDVESPLTPHEREMLAILAQQITLVVEKHQILEEKIALERKVMETEKLSSLGRLAASVAHEIKNPLSSVKAIIQTVREEVGPRTPIVDDLSVVVEEIDRLDQTVNRLLNYIKPELSPSKLVPVEGIADGVLDILRYEAQRRHVTFVKDYSADVHYVRGRVEDLKSIIFNIVLNGLEAMTQGGTLTVATRSSRLDDGARGRKAVRVEVADTGVGIPADRLRTLFEPFHSSKESGTGLGLVIVKQKVDELGGRIRVESEHGTRFSIELPVLGRA